MWHHWCQGWRIWNLLIPCLILMLSPSRFCLGRWVIKFIPPAAIISIVYKLQTGIFLAESMAVWDIKRQRSERRVGGDREVEERSLFSLFQWILSQHVYWEPVKRSSLTLCLGSLLCWFLPTRKSLPTPLVLFFLCIFFSSLQRLFVIQTHA